jgi:hypothetical protein
VKQLWAQLQFYSGFRFDPTPVFPRHNSRARSGVNREGLLGLGSGSGQARVRLGSGSGRARVGLGSGLGRAWVRLRIYTLGWNFCRLEKFNN